MDDIDKRTEILRSSLTHIYDAYRTALLNRKYYGHRLELMRRLSFWSEILIAVGATSSGGVAGLAIWGTITGQYVWLWISGVATVASVVKPAIQFSQSIENYTKLYAGHTNIYLTLKQAVEDINDKQRISPDSFRKYQASRDLNRELGGQDDPKPREGLVRRLQVQVNREIAPEHLWMP
jgi:hypothetical protein